MAKGRANHRGIKRHRSYTVDEAARALNVAKGTVRRWQKAGLPSIRDQQPALILGDDLIDYLATRRPQKQSCKLDECFCFSCRAPRPAAGRMADVTTNGTTTGNLRALCATCLTVMHKRLSVSKISELQRLLDVTITQAAPRLSEHLSPCLNDHSSCEGKTHA